MSKAKATVCTTCGAVVFSDRCDLCGTPVGRADVDETESPSVEEPAPRSDRPPATGKPLAVARKVERLVCPTCGAANKLDARFCDQCGQGFIAPEDTGRKDEQDHPVETPRRPKKPARRKDPAPAQTEHDAPPRIGLYVTVAIVAVVALYLLSVMTKGTTSTEAPTAQRPGAVASSSVGDIDTYLPEDEGLATQLAGKRDSIQSTTDPAEGQILREEVVQTYAGAGRLDLAGREQESIAEELKSADAWAAAGNMHFDWMENQQGDERVKAAQRAARDYEKALAIDPDNLDVRTDLGVAYLNDPSSPMLAIQNTNMVLEADSNHVQANFNKGVMLAQIGRTQEAIHHFQKVVRLSKEGDPAHDRALELLGQLGAPGAASKGGPSG